MHEIMLCSTKYLQFIYHKVLTILQFTFPQNLYTECEQNVPSANDSCVLICFNICLCFAVFVFCFVFFVLYYCLTLTLIVFPLSQYDTCVNL
jgi:hypothetical protein